MLPVGPSNTHNVHKHTFNATTTDFLTAASLTHTLGVGITAAAGTELALQFSCFVFTEHLHSRLITASCKEWAIFAPAAVLGRGSYLSGSLSGIKP